MADLTLGQVDERITEIDALVFRGITGQIPMRFERRSRLENEARALMEILADALRKRGAGEYQELYAVRQKLRQLTFVSAVTNRYMELHPEPQPNIDAIIAAVASGSSDGTLPEGQAGEILAAVFSELFVELPTELPPPPPPKNGLFRRIMGR